MAEQQLIQAIGRIERAVSRLETFRIPAASAGGGDIERRYKSLKSATEEAIAEIDRLIAREETLHG